MERKIFLILLALFTISVSAEVVEIDGISYNLISKGNIAEVTGNSHRSGDVVIPETVTYNDVTYSVTTIRKNAFANCNLNSIEIPSSITKICQEAFYNGKATSVKIKDLAAWCNINFESYFKTNPLSTASHLFLNDEEIHDLVIPDGVKTITSHAFYYFSGLTSVKIPSSVTSIGTECFAYCTNLMEVKLPSNLKKIDWCVFQYCTNLTSIDIPDNTQTIYICAFDGCTNLKTVTLGKSVNNIQNGAFANCPSLEDIYCKAKTPPTCYTAYNNLYAKTMDVFYDSYIEHATLHAPAKSIETYKTTEPWSKFKTFVPIIIPEHTLTYMVDGEVYKTYSIEEDEEIIAEPEPVREGFVFSGWSEIPETMPAHDVTVTGTFVAVPKCATPTIKYENGQLSFTCETEGAEFISEITDTDVTQHNSATISLSATYNISVYAVAPNHATSDMVKASLCWIDTEPTKEGMIEGITNVSAKAVLIQSNGNVLTIQGADLGTSINVFDVSGKKVGGAVVDSKITNVKTSLARGQVGIVNICDKSVKVIIK